MPTVTELRSRALDLTKHPRTRKISIWVISILVAIGVLFALIAPPLVRQKLASELSTTLHREVSIQQIQINPYALSTTVRGFLVKEPQGAATAVSFDELYLNVEFLSLFYRGIVLKDIRLVKPYINLVRNEDRTYNFTDLIQQFTKAPSEPAPPGPPPRFSLNNIEVIDGKIDFDDRPEGVKHAVSSIRIGIPFVSSIPYHSDITVEPAFSAVINGAPLEIGGETKPFKDSRESEIHFNIDNVQIPKYVEYSPVELNFKVPSGEIDGKLRASFRMSKDTPSVLSISGDLALKDLVLQANDDAPLLKLPSMDLALDSLEVFANRAGVKSIKIREPEVHLILDRDGRINVASLVTVNTQEKVPEEKKDRTPFGYRIDEILLDEGKLFFEDRSPKRPFEKRFENIRISVKGLTTEPDKKAETELSFQADGKEQFSHSGTLQLAPFSAQGKVQLEGLQLKGLRPYYESVVGVDIREGVLDVASSFDFEQKAEGLEGRLSELNAALKSLRMDVPGESEPLWRIPLLSVKDATIDLGKKSVVIGALESRGGNAFVHREADGTISYARLVKAQAEKPAKQPDKPHKDTGWRVDAKRVAFERFRVLFEDRSLPARARVVVSDLSARGENLTNAKGRPGKATVQAKINNKGVLKLAGTAGTNPVDLKLVIEGQAIELLPFEPYLANRVNFLLTGGQIGTKGNFTYQASGEGPAKINYDGSVQVADFAAVEKDGSEDLLRWQSLGLEGLQFALEPMRLRISEINLAEFYARLILGADGKLNLRNLTVQKNDNAAVETEPAKPAEPAATTASTEKQITIGKINLLNGNVRFSDFFVKPNYSANLTGVQGSISELKPETPGDLAIQAKLDNAAPVDIQGKINPLSNELYMEIAADARDIELNPMSPYSVKYVGYGIEKGKLSFKVKYKLESRKLTAENQIILNQLTFGERVESPTATRLPVLLAVALLKDRNGVIDVNLPVSGSLDDPQFSVGGIVLRLVLNIITKAVTAPFALLGAVFGGGGEELSYVEFDYGRDTLTPAAENKLKTLSTAMTNRPALKLEISPRVDARNDLEGLRKLSIERKVKAQKLKELVRQGSAPASLDEVQVATSEYERFLKAAYGEESFPKPRNVIGLAKDLPRAEIENLMLKHTNISDQDLRDLANRRALAVRDYLLRTKGLEVDRLFIVAPKPASDADGETAKTKGSRVEFALK
ncbi:MAG TPA: DUF748 domain-containing protein [Candidatus Binatia bacterium]|nr:DUF748 domain-containing protein [Candidatus Binatia bacterium]